jgi:ATP-binding cassette subfamily F protein 3
MRLLAGVDGSDAGTRVIGHNVVPDYFAQDQAAVLDSSSTVYEEMSAASPSTMVPMIRTILGGFLFSGDDVYKKVAVLSGGERNRLALAKMLLKASNLLLLDEPTNHLDLDSKEILLDALKAYGGTIIFVSHDRYFVDQLATRVAEIGEGELIAYPGGYEEFVDWKTRRAAGLETALPSQPARPEALAAATPTAAPTAKSASGPTRTPPASRGRNEDRPAAVKAAEPKPAPYDAMAPRLRPKDARADRQARERELKKTKARLAELERRIAEKEQAVKELERQMASPGFYDVRSRADKAVADHKALMFEVGELMSQWEALQEHVEAQQAEA